jgi:hypothetical protein
LNRVGKVYVSSKRDTLLADSFEKFITWVTTDQRNEFTGKGEAFYITGESGAGKTDIVRNLLKTHKVLQPIETPIGNIEPAISISLPGPATLKVLALKILAKSGYGMNPKKQEALLWYELPAALQSAGIMFVHIDEFQHLFHPGCDFEGLVKYIKGLMNDDDWPVSFIISGMPSVRNIIINDPQAERRNNSFTLDTFHRSRHQELVQHIIRTLAEAAPMEVDDLLSSDMPMRIRNSEAFDADVLTSYILSDRSVAALAQQTMPSAEDGLVLRQFVLNNVALPDDVYRSYVRKMPSIFRGFPDVGASKTTVLIEERKVAFTPENFQHLKDVEHRLKFAALNFDVYAARQSEYPVDDEFRGKLLQTGITDAQKLNVLADIDETYVASTPSVAAIVGPLLARSSATRGDHGAEFIKAVVLHSADVGVQVSLLNQLHSALSVPEIRSILSALPMPFQDIARFGKAPKLENSEPNRYLAQWLKDRDVISSFSETLLTGEIKINTFRKEPDP